MNNVDLRSGGVILLILGVKVDTYNKLNLFENYFLRIILMSVPFMLFDNIFG